MKLSAASQATCDGMKHDCFPELTLTASSVLQLPPEHLLRVARRGRLPLRTSHSNSVLLTVAGCCIRHTLEVVQRVPIISLPRLSRDIWQNDRLRGRCSLQAQQSEQTFSKSSSAVATVCAGVRHALDRNQPRRSCRLRTNTKSGVTPPALVSTTEPPQRLEIEPVPEAEQCRPSTRAAAVQQATRRRRQRRRPAAGPF